MRILAFMYSPLVVAAVLALASIPTAPILMLAASTRRAWLQAVATLVLETLAVLAAAWVLSRLVALTGVRFSYAMLVFPAIYAILRGVRRGKAAALATEDPAALLSPLPLRGRELCFFLGDIFGFIYLFLYRPV